MGCVLKEDLKKIMEQLLDCVNSSVDFEVTIDNDNIYEEEQHFLLGLSLDEENESVTFVNHQVNITINNTDSK